MNAWMYVIIGIPALMYVAVSLLYIAGIFFENNDREDK